MLAFEEGVGRGRVSILVVSELLVTCFQIVFWSQFCFLCICF